MESSPSIDGRLDEAMDHLGRTVEPRREGNRLLLRVGEGPIYLIGPERIELEHPAP